MRRIALQPSMSIGAAFRLSLVSIVTVSVSGQTPPANPAAEALARPISPGSVALLLPHAGQPAAVERLTQALADPRPEVRAVAARIAFTTRHLSLVPALTAALEKEQSPVAGTEIVRALTLIQGAAADAAVRAALPRLDSRATLAWADTVVRVRPADLWRQVADLPNATALGDLLFDTAVAQPDAASETFANLRATPAVHPAVRAILRHARVASKLPPWPIVAACLATPGPPRQDAALLLLALQTGDVALPPEAAAAFRELSSATDLAWMPVYTELSRRRAEPDTPPRPLVAQIDRIDLANAPEDLSYTFLTAYFEKAETAAFRRVAGPRWEPQERPKAMPSWVKPQAVTAAVDEPPKRVTRLARPMSVAMMRDLVTWFRCSPEAGQFGEIDVQYRPTGQVRSVSRAAGAGCAQVAVIVASLEVAPGHETLADGRVEHLVIGLRPSDLSCERYAPALEPPPRPFGALITPPKKTKNISPVYPDAAQKQGIQGVVVIEASIQTSGCVAEARVLRSVPGLDEAAIAAVSVWEYETARLDGKPVPMIMTVTVNFTLTR